MWIAIVAGLNYVVVPLGVDYERDYYICTLYFLFFAGAGIYHYRIKEALAHHVPFRHQALMIAALTVVALVVGFFIAAQFPISAEKAEQIRATHVLFPLFNYGTWITKLADITFQQVFVFALLKALQFEAGLNKKNAVLTTASAFAVLHLPLLIMLGVYGLYFIVPAVFAGFLFAYFIMYLRHGIFYSWGLHLVFYVALGIGLRYV